MSVKSHFKGYSSGLSPQLYKFYADKLTKFDLNDPYEILLSEFEEDIEKWPEITHGDIVYYLVFGTNTVTHQQMKAYKSMEAHNYYTSGWVNNKVFAKNLQHGRVLMLGEVKHSQSLRAVPLKVWLVVKEEGEILTGHCTCMAGMGEACSHIGAFLFYLEAGVRFRNDESCTDKRNTWLQPYVKNVEFLRLKDINFQSASMKCKQADLETISKKQKVMPSVAEPNDEELHQFFSELDEAGLNSVVLSVVEPFNQKFCTEDESIKTLTNLYSSEHTQLSWKDLLDKCREVSEKLIITKSESEKIELMTKNQSKCKKWFQYRTGRVTASNMKAICRTDIDCPSKSLLKKICYPSSMKFSTVATQWGKNNETVAKDTYLSRVKKEHTNLKLSESGLHINPTYPYMGASPDATTSCDCCGQGIIEVKCPYSCKNDSIIDICAKGNTCLIEDEVGNITLDKNHEYYYQIQTQLLVTNANHCDFVVWTNNDIHIERFYHDEVLLETINEKSLLYFTFCILPELLAKWHSNN